MSFSGPPGTGKSKCAQDIIAECFKEKCGDSVVIDRKYLSSSEELSGSNQKPGLLISILEQACLQKACGSIVILDEGIKTINDNANVAKLTFQDTPFARTEFLDNIDFLQRPTLFLFTGNGDIEDEALRIRFCAIPFPTPKPALLEAQAIKHVQHVDKEKGEINLLCQEVKACKNFRDVEKCAQAAISTWDQGKSLSSWDCEEKPEPPTYPPEMLNGKKKKRKKK